VPARDPEHWLYRLDAGEWLRAAATELGHAYRALEARSHRPGLTHARRAAGMALNGVLVLAGEPDPRYGRSYVDHLRALAGDGEAPERVRAAAGKLMETPIVSPLVTLARSGPIELADAARAVIDWAVERVAAAEAD
jgi:HEPN domain-containing protein